MRMKIIQIQGFTLIEVLVALLVLSIGLLGLAGLQINVLNANSSALWHSQAAQYAYDMADRMRVNRTAALNGSYDALDTSTVTDTLPTPDCTSASCSPVQIEAFDAYEWKKLVESLPGGRGMIALDAASGQRQISVMWDEDGSGGTDCTNDLECFQVFVGL